jgi:hypothetical protein
MRMTIGVDGVTLNGAAVPRAHLEGDSLTWSGGVKDWFEGKVTFLTDPITSSVELFGHTRSLHEPELVHCYGARLLTEAPAPERLPLPDWALEQLARVASAALPRGGLLLWHKWEKSAFTHRALTTQLMPLLS